MPSPEEINAIFDRILAGQATEADIHALRFELQQGKYRIEAGQLSANEIHIGDRIYYGADADAIKPVLRSILDEQQKLLEQQRAKRPRLERDFLGMMKAEVVDSLKQSLHHAVLMNLGKEEQPEQVKRLWDAKIKVADQPNVLLPNDTKTIEVFDREDIAGRLLILGNPGSGKTTTLLELAKALIERSETEQDSPMPVLFNLSSWKDDKQPLHEWMVQELKLRIRSDITRKWLDDHLLLPLLDGLDEMAADRQEICVKAINQQLLTGEKSLPYLVVCSRNEEYDNYETKLLLNGAISIQALTINKIQSYLSSIDQTELRHTLDRDSDLLALIRTPLFLSIAALSFQELSQERWQTLTTTKARIEYLLDSYVFQMLERPIPHNMFGKWKTPSSPKARKWLIWLARQMQRESKSEFLIERMQPSLLSTSSKLRTYKLVTGLISGMIFGLILYALFGFNGFDASKLSMINFYSLRDGVLFVITSAFACGSSSVTRPFDSHKVRVKVRHRVLSGLIFGLLFSLYFWYSYSSNTTAIENAKIFVASNANVLRVNVSQIVFLKVATYGLIAGMVGFWIRGLEAEIKTVESLQWSWRKVRNKFISGIRYNLKTALVISLVFTIMGTLASGIATLIACLSIYETQLAHFSSLSIEGKLAIVFLIVFIIYAESIVRALSMLFLFVLVFLVGLIIVLIISSISGLEGRDVKYNLFPNQGIKRSLAISVTSGFIGGLVYLSISELSTLLEPFLWNSRNATIHTSSLLVNIVSSLLLLTFLAILVGVPILVQVRGGSACIQHCVLRLMLHHSGYIPRNYARFLDYCTERSLLQRVGGRYRFIHRLLQEHFAAMPFDGTEGNRQRSTL